MKILTTALLLLAAQSAFAATLQFDGSGNLIGATGVVVNDVTYKIELRETTCAVEYDGCDVVESTDFPFGSSPNSGSLAIVDQVLPGLTSDQITGCSRTEHPRLSFCDLITPATQSNLIIGSPARVDYLGNVNFPGNSYLGPNFDFSQASTRVLVVWTQDPPLPARCSDGNDNDGDGLIDFPGDPGCSNQGDDNEADATLIFDSAGSVIGATGVDILGTTYDVEFRDGTCAALYGGCDENSDFIFRGEGLANEASLALARHVLPGLTPKSFEGCGPGPIGSCRIMTPWNTSVTVSMALSVGPDDARFIGNMRISLIDDFSSNDATTFAIWSLPEPPAQCADGLDNDSDGLIDYPSDPGCVSVEDDSEIDPLPQCSDGLDNDNDGLIDYPSDPGCDSVDDNSEIDPLFQCSDDLDNDNDGLIDYPDDPGCDSVDDNSEIDSLRQCGDGLDNDNDGLVDYPSDPGCVSADDDSEIDPLFQCGDGVDNDADGLIDFPEDPGCSDAADNDEFNSPVVQGIPDFVGGQLRSRSEADQTTATINGRLTLLVDRDNPGRYQCYDSTLATVPCGSEGIPPKDQIFSDLANCPTLDMGDGTVLGSDTAEGCLLYRAVTPANRAPRGMAVAFQVQHQYSSAGTFTVALESCCRANSFLNNDLHVNNPGTPYRLETVIDVGMGNTSPGSAVPPVIACPAGGLCQFDIPAVDDTSLPGFRLAGPNEASPDRSFTQPPGASIGASTGSYLWDTRGLADVGPNQSHNYSTQVVMTDGVAESTEEFLIRLVSDESDPPIIDPPNPPCLAVFPNSCEPPGEIEPPQDSLPICGTTRVFNRGGEYSFTVKASDPDAGDSVTLDVAGLPDGAEMDPVLPVVGNPTRANFTWVPLVLGKFMINFHASSSGGATAQCPVEIEVVDVVAPDFVLLDVTFFAEPWGHPSFPAAWRIRPIATVRNAGNVGAGARVEFSMTRRELPMVRRSVGESIWLDPGERQFVEPFNEIWIDLDGTYDYTVVVDGDDEVVEIDETNNSLSFVTSFNVGARSADLDGDLDVDIEDVRIITAARNQEAQPGDPRDLNQDGLINVLDARMAALSCTQPRCR